MRRRPAPACAPRMCVLCCALALAGCAATAPVAPGTLVPIAAINQALVPGVTTRAMLLAQFGATTAIRFDSGVEVWCYRLAAPAGGDGGDGEYVIVLDPHGVVTKARHAPVVYQLPPQK